MKQRILAFLCGMACIQFLAGQNTNVPLGEWRVHLPHREAVDLEEVGDKIYVGTTSSLWCHDKATGERVIFSKATGLSGVGISSMGYSSTAGALVIVYDNADIDLIKGSEIINMPQIKNAGIIGSLKVNNISVYGDTAILSCDFGVVTLDLTNEVVKFSVQFNSDAEFATQKCMDAEIYNGKYYFATTERIYTVNISSNILSLDNWDTTNYLPPGAYNQLGVFDNKLYAGFSTSLASGGMITNEDTLFIIDASNNRTVYSGPPEYIYGITTLNGHLTITYKDEAYVYAPGGALAFSAGSDLFLDATNGIYASDGNAYFSDFKTGLSRAGTAPAKLFFPDGPNTNKAYDLVITTDGTIYLCTGGRDLDWKNQFYKDGIYYRKENDWKALSIPDFGFQEVHQDLVSVVLDPADPNHVYAGAWGTGLYDIQNFTVESQILNPPFDQSPVGFPYRIGSLAYDDQGNLWASNANSASPLKYLTPQGTWVSGPNFGQLGMSSANATGDVVIDDQGQVWLAVIGKGVLVYDPETGFRRLFGSTFNNGDLPDLFIRTIEKDLDGDIWVGTSNGLRVGSPTQVTNSAYNFQKIVLVADDGINELLLDETIINDIEIDGANRKWIATYGSGVRLVSEDGRDIIQSFRAENSPLLSNVVWNIEIDPITGEVYFATDKGLCSYKSDATFADNSFGNVLVYPNPVKPDYEGPIAINGMAENADIKITDIQGNLVYETKALGGQAIWDGKRYDGKRVQTGVYLIFCANEDASETLITKILFIN